MPSEAKIIQPIGQAVICTPGDSPRDLEAPAIRGHAEAAEGEAGMEALPGNGGGICRGGAVGDEERHQVIFAGMGDGRIGRLGTVINQGRKIASFDPAP